jgi:hypothetical protein
MNRSTGHEANMKSAMLVLRLVSAAAFTALVIAVPVKLELTVALSATTASLMLMVGVLASRRRLAVGA